MPLQLPRVQDPIVDRALQLIGQQLNPPVPQARVYNSVDITVATGTGTVLTFDSEHWDEGDLHSTSANTGRLTAPVSGLYLVGACVAWGSSAAGVRVATLRANGTATIVQEAIDVDSAQGHTHNLETVYQLTAGQYVEVVVAQSSGGNLEVDAQANYSPEFWMVRLSGFTAQVID